MYFTAVSSRGFSALAFLFAALAAPGQDIGVVSAYRYNDPPNNKVVIFPLNGGPLREIVIGEPTGGMGITPDGVLAVTHASWVSFFDLNSTPPAFLGKVSVPSPCPVNGVELSPNARFLLTIHVWCAYWMPSYVTTIDVATRQVIGSVNLGPTDAFDTIFTTGSDHALLFGWSWWRTLGFDSAGAISSVSDPTYGTKYATQGSALVPGGRLALLTNGQSQTVTVLSIDAAGAAAESGFVNMNGWPQAVAINGAGRRAYVTEYTHSTVAVLAIAGSSVSDTNIRIALPYQVYTGFGMNGIAVTEDGRRAYVGLTDWFTNNGVWMIDLTTNTLVPGPLVATGGIPREIRLATLVLPVGIDIKPGSYPNSINLRSQGTVPVAVLSSRDFDAATVNPSTVRFAGAAVALRGKDQPMAGLEDVNGDLLKDLVLHFATADLQLTPASTEAVLTGTTYSGRRIRGKDSVRVLD